MSQASELERQMLDLINAERTLHGLNPVQLERRLNASSEDHSEWMLQQDIFSHTGASDSSAGDRMRAAGFDFSGTWTWAENIAWQSERGAPGLADDVINLHNSLMNSPGHRANILNPDVELVGIGIEQGNFSGHDSVMVTQNFARTSAPVQLDTPDGSGGEQPTPQATMSNDDLFLESPGTLSGLEGDDTLTGSTGADVLNGNDGDDRLVLGAGNDSAFGGDGSDSLYGGDGNDILNGGDGADVIEGGEGHDRVWAGAGDTGADFIQGQGGDDIIAGGAGNDRIDGGEGSDTIFGGDGDDTIDDHFTEEVVTNVIWAGSGNDSVTSGHGHDSVGGGLGNDTIASGAGNDTIYAGKGDGNDNLAAGLGDDLVFAGAGQDYLYGNEGNDTLYSGTGHDWVEGGDGNDFIYAGADNDEFTGGNGDDTFAFTNTGAFDTIYDFQLTADASGTIGDILDFSGVTSMNSVGDVLAAMVDDVSGVRVDMGTGLAVTLTGLTVADFTSATDDWAVF